MIHVITFTAGPAPMSSGLDAQSPARATVTGEATSGPASGGRFVDALQQPAPRGTSRFTAAGPHVRAW